MYSEPAAVGRLINSSYADRTCHSYKIKNLTADLSVSNNQRLYVRMVAPCWWVAVLVINPASSMLVDGTWAKRNSLVKCQIHGWLLSHLQKGIFLVSIVLH